MWRVCVVVPTRNEEGSIERVINEIRDAFEPQRFAPPVILVVDDSSDSTRRIAQSLGAEVLVGGGRGLGAAMYDGLKAALRYKPDFILAIDGDGQADPAEINRFLKPVIDGEADMVLGSRFCEPGLIDYNYRFINRFGTVILSRILRSFTNLKITDSHGGIRAMRPEVVEELEMLGTHTYVQETIIDAAEKGFRIVEIPSVWRKREHGKSRVVGSIPKYVFYTLPILVMRSGQHIRVLYSLGMVLMAVAMLGFLVVFAQEGFDLKGIWLRQPAIMIFGILISLGVQSFFFGLVLQLLKQIKHQVDRVSVNRRTLDREYFSLTPRSQRLESGPKDDENATAEVWVGRVWEAGHAARSGSERT